MWTMIFLLIKVSTIIPLVTLCIRFEKMNVISTKESIFLRTSCILLSISYVFLIVFLKYDKMSMVAQILNIVSSIGLLLYYSKIKNFIFESNMNKLYKYCMYYVYICNTAIMSLIIIVGLIIFTIIKYIGNSIFLDIMQYLLIIFNILFILIITGSYIYLYSDKKNEDIQKIDDQQESDKNIFDEIDDLF